MGSPPPSLGQYDAAPEYFTFLLFPFSWTRINHVLSDTSDTPSQRRSTKSRSLAADFAASRVIRKIRISYLYGGKAMQDSCKALPACRKAIAVGSAGAGYEHVFCAPSASTTYKYSEEKLFRNNGSSKRANSFGQASQSQHRRRKERLNRKGGSRRRERCNSTDSKN